MAEEEHSDWLTPKDHTRKTGIFRVRSRRERQRERVLQDWLGDEDMGEAEVGAHKRDGCTLGDACDFVLEQLDTPGRRTMRVLMQNWAEIAGGFATQCSPRNLRRDGTLFVAVANPALGFQLRFQERALLQRIHALGLNDVVAIRYGPGGATIDEKFD